MGLPYFSRHIFCYTSIAVVLNLSCFIVERQLLAACETDREKQTVSIRSATRFICDSNFTEQVILSMWYFENQTLHKPLTSQSREVSTNNGRYTFRLLENIENITSAVFEITNVTFTDAGTYTCVMRTRQNRQTEMRHLQVYGLPTIHLKDPPIEDHIFDVECCFDVSPISTVIEHIWMLNKDTVYPSNSSGLNITYHDSSICSILIFQFDRNDNGKELLCAVENDRETLSKVILSVKYPAGVKMINSTNINFTNDTTYVLILCLVDGNPNPEVLIEKLIYKERWKTVGPMTMIESNKEKQLWEFYLSSEDGHTSGIYRCTADNGIGNVDVSNNVKVEVKSSRVGAREENIWVTYIGAVVTIAALLVIGFITGAVLLCRKMRSRPYTSVKSGRKGLSQDQYITSLHGTDYYLDMYQSISEEGPDFEQRQLMKLNENVITFVSKLSQESGRERWIGILNKGMPSERNVHMSSYPASYMACSMWKYFTHHITSLPNNGNIVTTFGFFEKSGMTYLVQEYFAFGTVRTYLEITFGQNFHYGNALEPVPEQFLTFASNVINGMKFLHQHGWVHPGLCTQKLLISSVGPSSFSCKLYDFCHAMASRERMEGENRKVELH